MCVKHNGRQPRLGGHGHHTGVALVVCGRITSLNDIRLLGKTPPSPTLLFFSFFISGKNSPTYMIVCRHGTVPHIVHRSNQHNSHFYLLEQ